MTTLMLSRLQWEVGHAQWSDLRGDVTVSVTEIANGAVRP